MNLRIKSGSALVGEVSLPGDKSISHRAALFSALAFGKSKVMNFLKAGVTDVMLNAIEQLGVNWTLQQNELIILSKGFKNFTPLTKTLYCGNSGTTLRLLTGALVSANVKVILDGSEGLRKRPMRRVVDPLKKMGAQIEITDQGTAPIEIFPLKPQMKLSGIEHILSVASAQVKTAILLAGLTADGKTTIIEPMKSRDHTERMFSGMGLTLSEQHEGLKHIISLDPLQGRHLQPLDFTIPGDFSSASFLIVSALITPGSEIVLKSVGLNPTRTGLLDVLLRMGADISINNQVETCNESVGDIIIKHSQLGGIKVTGEEVVRMIDEFPVFAVAAAYAEGETEVSGAIELRYKESDRISAICNQLSSVGVKVVEKDDGFIVFGCEQPSGGESNPGGDHRLAMAMVVCGLNSKGTISISQADIFLESFPDFVRILKSLGANITYE
ncbi:MAG: 3-phosphoshikimate 1-carboxyvinyltransferase [Anaerolineaceae bacterium]|nr:3-phosphoshikimate 1-carboxyvinyltransferase [Anaerolineaceae bacterium]